MDEDSPSIGMMSGNEGTDPREQAWLDQLKADELAVTERLRTMKPRMATAYLGVEIFRLRQLLEKMTTVTINGKKGFTVSPAVATALGAALAGVAYGIAKVLGV